APATTTQLAAHAETVGAGGASQQAPVSAPAPRESGTAAVSAPPQVTHAAPPIATPSRAITQPPNAATLNSKETSNPTGTISAQNEVTAGQAQNAGTTNSSSVPVTAAQTMAATSTAEPSASSAQPVANDQATAQSQPAEATVAGVPAAKTADSSSNITSDSSADGPRLAMRAADPSLRTVFKVKYVAKGVAYLDGGRSAGLKEG